MVVMPDLGILFLLGVMILAVVEAFLHLLIEIYFPLRKWNLKRNVGSTQENILCLVSSSYLVGVSFSASKELPLRLYLDLNCSMIEELKRC